MASNIYRMLIDIFPDAVYTASGLDAGQWITEGYKFNIVAGYYTSKTTGKSFFVSGSVAWRQTFTNLKELENKYSEPNPIGKG